MEPSSSILEGVRQGDGVAWSRLVQLCAPVVARWCRRTGLQDADVDNVVQDVFHTLARTIGDFRRDRGGRFVAWLSAITRSRLVDHWRRQAAEPPAVGGSDHRERLEREPTPGESSSDPPDAGVLDLYRRALDLMRTEFEELTWQAFWRSVVEEQPTAEIAAALGVSEITVRSYKSRVLNRLRAQFGDLLE
jgi:RNA polymerase sigma-70 factor (ECF subfamily)